MEKRKIKDLFKYLPKAKHKAGEGLEVGEYPFYTSSAVVNKYYNEYDYEPNKLIFATGGSASVHYADSRFAVSTDNFILEPNDGINAKYVYYYLKSNIGILQNGFHGAGLQHLSKDYLSDIAIPVISPDQQQKIVDILDKADEIRIKKRLANDKLDEFLKSTFISMFGDPVKNEKGIRKVSIDSIKANEKNAIVDGPFGSSLKNEDYFESGVPIIRINNIRPCKFYNAEFKYIKESKYEQLIRSKVNYGDVLMARVGNTIGKSCLYDQSKKALLSTTGVCKITCDNTKIINKFLLLQMNMDTYKAYIVRQVKGAGQPCLNLTTIKNFDIILPTLEQQKKCVQIVEKVEEQKQKNEQVIEQMDNLFNSLSQRVFKGELVQSSSIDLITKQTVLHAKIIDKCNSHQTFGAVKMEKIFNLCDMSQVLNLVPGGYYRKAAGPYVPEMRHSVEEKLAQNNWVKTINKGNGKKVEFKKDTKFAEYKNLYSEIFKDYEEQINKIIDYFYDKDTDYCEAFSTLYMCWNDLILEGKNPSKFEIIDEFKNHWAPEKQRFERIYLLEILSDMSNQGFEPQGHGTHTIESNYNHNKDQLGLQLK